MKALPSLEMFDSRRPHIHRVRRGDLAALYRREPHHVFFRIQTADRHDGESDSVEDHLGITLVELAKCLPWIPGNSIIFLYCAGGFSPLLNLELSCLHTDRNLFLVDDAASTLDVPHKQADESAL